MGIKSRPPSALVCVCVFLRHCIPFESLVVVAILAAICNVNSQRENNKVTRNLEISTIACVIELPLFATHYQCKQSHWAVWICCVISDCCCKNEPAFSPKLPADLMAHLRAKLDINKRQYWLSDNFIELWRSRKESEWQKLHQQKTSILWIPFSLETLLLWSLARFKLYAKRVKLNVSICRRVGAVNNSPCFSSLGS